jgi:hypothetical protein
MSIYDEIDGRVKEGRLSLLLPAMPSGAVVRRIYVSPEVNSLVYGPWGDREWEQRCGQLRADLDRFIEGRLITVGNLSTPYKGKTSYMKRLNRPHDEVWEIRSIDPHPGIRVFGRFADTDVFIALTWAKRPDLRGPRDREWRDSIEACKAEWRKLFPAYQPKSGADIRDYISTNVVLV